MNPYAHGTLRGRLAETKLGRSRHTVRGLTQRHPMSSAMAITLSRAARAETPRGTALLYEHQGGHMRQVRALKRRGYITYDGGRAVATQAGVKALNEWQP
jgi:hypothetical protein